MSIKTFGVAVVSAGFVMFPLAACGSSPATTATTVTATATAPASTSSSSCTISNGYENWESCWKAEQRQHSTTTTSTPTAAPPQAKSSGLPWWSWLLIVPAGLIGVLVLGFKVLEANDDRTIARANARVAELDARPRPVLDYDEWEEDDEDDDELPAEDIEFLHRVTDPTPSTPAPSAPPAAGGNLLSSLRQQNQ